MFLVVDVPCTLDGLVVIMEIKEYADGQDRLFKAIPLSDWVTLTTEKKLLKQFTPKY